MLYIVTFEGALDDMYPVRHRCKGPVMEVDRYRHDYTICGRYALLVHEEDLSGEEVLCVECEAGAWGGEEERGT